MFTTTGLFRNIPCPKYETCNALNCIFSHDPPIQPGAKKSSNATIGHRRPSADDTTIEEPAAKRLKAQAGDPTPGDHGNDILSKYKMRPAAKSQLQTNGGTSKPSSDLSKPKTLEKPITPPINGIASGKTAQTRSVAKPAGKLALNPRMLSTSPAGHDKRTLYLKYLHEQLKRLNGLVAAGTQADRDKLSLDDQELIKAALDEEYQLALNNPNVYPNAIKQRIGTYKKMSELDWITHIKEKIFAPKKPAKAKSIPPPLSTGLSTKHELRILTDMRSDMPTLAKMGYVMSPPTENEIRECRSKVDKCNNYEECDRCKSRFQVFPDRRASDGALTTNGPCKYHWGKMRRPKREKTDAITGAREAVYLCCGELLGAPGCSTCDSHVFKMSEPARLAGVVPFVETPKNERPKLDAHGQAVKAVTFDCEMAYTSYGMECIRLTAVTWPEGKELIDVLVRPKGTILDLNTRFSGIDDVTFREAEPWKPGDSPLPAKSGGASPRRLAVTPSVEVARELLCSFIQPETPLIGHALENDVSTIRLCHPTIIDTVDLFPHPAGLPIRFGLRALTLTHLERDIQTGGEAGHDSLEDARATGDLVRFKVGRRWAMLQSKGWTWKGDELVRPPSEVPVPVKDEA